jgi:hypothetical protein
VSPKTRALADKVVEQIGKRRPETPEEIEAWAKRLAEDVSDAND